jgi:Rieske Fe-S protein
METPILPLPFRTRREFCAEAASMLAAGVLAGCGGSPSSPSSNTPQLTTMASTVSGRTISLTVDAASPLASVGSAVQVQTSLGTFLVSRTSQDAFTALTAVCTHEGCTITGFEASRYVCPCHGSTYSTAGAVLMGPAPRSLQQYATQFANGVVTFSV